MCNIRIRNHIQFSHSHFDIRQYTRSTPTIVPRITKPVSGIDSLKVISHWPTVLYMYVECPPYHILKVPEPYICMIHWCFICMLLGHTMWYQQINNQIIRFPYSNIEHIYRTHSNKSSVKKNELDEFWNILGLRLMKIICTNTHTHTHRTKIINEVYVFLPPTYGWTFSKCSYKWIVHFIYDLHTVLRNFHILSAIKFLNRSSLYQCFHKSEVCVTIRCPIVNEIDGCLFSALFTTPFIHQNYRAVILYLIYIARSSATIWYEWGWIRNTNAIFEAFYVIFFSLNWLNCSLEPENIWIGWLGKRPN